MTECCLLLICCPPAARKEKALHYYEALGFDEKQADLLSDVLLEMVDKLLALTPAQIAAMKSEA